MNKYLSNAWKKTYYDPDSAYKAHSNIEDPHFVEYFLGLPSLLHSKFLHYLYIFLGGWIYYPLKNTLKLLLEFPLVLLEEYFHNLQNMFTNDFLKKLFGCLEAFFFAAGYIIDFYLVIIIYVGALHLCITFAPVLGILGLFTCCSFILIAGEIIGSLNINTNRISNPAITPPLYRRWFNTILNKFGVRNINTVTMCKDTLKTTEYLKFYDFDPMNTVCALTKIPLGLTNEKDALLPENKIVKWGDAYCLAHVLPPAILKQCEEVPASLMLTCNPNTICPINLKKIDVKDTYYRSPYGHYYEYTPALWFYFYEHLNCPKTGRYLSLNMLRRVRKETYDTKLTDTQKISLLKVLSQIRSKYGLSESYLFIYKQIKRELSNANITTLINSKASFARLFSKKDNNTNKKCMPKQCMQIKIKHSAKKLKSSVIPNDSPQYLDKAGVLAHLGNCR